MFRWGVYACGVNIAAFLVGAHYGVVGVAVAYCLAYSILIFIPGFLIPFRLINLRMGEFAAYLTPQLSMTFVMLLACVGWISV